MGKHSQKEALQRALDYLQSLHDEFIDEIESKTRDISIHRARREHLNDICKEPPDMIRQLQAWRRTSFALHQRRSKLKTMDDNLVRQINEVKMTLDRLEDMTARMSVSHEGVSINRPNLSMPLQDFI
ncbi:MAG: hypothetical protein KKD44_20380 [Proteobacteria bacterium]|nr:hypothetical protein [Pseudomonadota bacterium]